MDIREALMKASETVTIDEGATPGGDASAEPVVETPSETSAPADGAAQPASPEHTRDERGRFQTKPDGTQAAGGKPAPVVDPKAAAAPAAPADGKPAAGAKPPDQAQHARAPQSWKPAVREKFGALPADVQEEVVRRERDAARLAQENAQLRQSSGQVDQLIRPYESAIRAQGQEPMQYLGSVLQSAHVIFNGPPQHRAAALAEVIANAGVPPDLLDRALAARFSGQAPQVQPQRQQQEFRDPRVDRMLEERQRRAEVDADAKVKAFAEKHPFYEDVAPTMSSMLEAMAKNGQHSISTEDIERVYTAACLSHPDVAPVFEQRRAAEAAAKARASTQRSQVAASSVQPRPAAAPAAQPKGTRAALQAAAEKLGM